MKKITIAVSLLLAVCLLPQVALGQVAPVKSANKLQSAKLQAVKPEKVRAIAKSLVRVHIATPEEVAARQAEKALFDQFRQVIAMNDYEGLARLLEQGADPNLKEESSGMTPLMVATVTGARFSIVQLLLDKGASKDAKDYLGKTAADYAQMRAQATLALLNGALESGQSENLLPLEENDETMVEMMRSLFASHTPKTMSVDAAYQMLGVHPEDHMREIVAAYRWACKGLHPDELTDKTPEEQAAAAARLKKVQEAYRVIIQSRTPKADK